MTVAVGAGPDDCVYCLCQHGHAASCLLPGWGRSRHRPGRSHRVAHLWRVTPSADRLLIRPARWARPEPANQGQV